MEYMLQFDEIVLDVQPFIQCAYYALKQINTSPKLKALLRVCFVVYLFLQFLDFLGSL